jgi:diguanylate cyclase (GGDEF)-like protein/PAS domain S-box-containing protein
LSESRFYREIVEAGTVAVVVVAVDGAIRYLSPTARRMLCVGDTQVKDEPLAAMFSPDTNAAVDAYLLSLGDCAASQSRWTEAEVVADGGDVRTLGLSGVNLAAVPAVGGLVITLSDLTESRRREEELVRAADVDALTGLANRRAFDAITETVARGPAGRGCVVVLDLDSFKAINDRFGHSVGDEVLREVGARLRLRAGLQDAVVVARLGGDEFGAVFSDCGPAVARHRVERALRRLRQPMAGIAAKVMVTASAGVAATDGIASGRLLWERADHAMYLAKSSGQVHVFSGEDADWERRRKDAVEWMRSEVEQAQREARTDALTGLPNRRHFEEVLEELDEMARETRRSYGVVFVDVDHFHALNRARSDVEGDDTLRQVAAVLGADCRADDFLFRKGGEEFVVLITEATVEHAFAVGERLRFAVETAQIPHGGGQLTVTISGGVAVLDVRRHPTATAVIDQASRAMATAKSAGRNRVCRPPES